MQIRNIAIVAHVDHGKTTLIDALLKQTHMFRDNQAEMEQTTLMDSNDLEREKGITILAKNTAVEYLDYKINIIDTPGHADFGGEVERVISMADGALLIVDAAEGPLPQTKFVLQQAFKCGLKIMVLINKIDRKDAEPDRILAQTEELFLQLADTEEQLVFPVLYGIGRDGKIWNELPADSTAPGDVRPLFDQIIKTVPPPSADPNRPFKMQVSNLDFDTYKGNYAIGKVAQGVVKVGQPLVILNENEVAGQAKISHLFTSKGLDRVESNECQAGDIIAVTGIEGIKIGQTLADPADPTGYPMITITEPSLEVEMAVSTSPFVGREGEFSTARQIEERFKLEQKTNIGLRITKKTGSSFLVAGRGELHLAILIEEMRREGYEMQVSKPEVIIKEVDGVKQEPVEEVHIEIDQEYVGAVTEELGKRQAMLKDSITNDKGITRMVYEVTSRNLLGFRSDILTKTRGTGLFSYQFLGYQPLRKHIQRSRNGVIIASENGEATVYALDAVQERGDTFIDPGQKVYEGQIIGLAKFPQDIEMNVSKAKKLTNFRSNADIATILAPSKKMSLEQGLDFIESDELMEVTPLSIRFRKKFLNRNDRNKAAKRSEA
jgi:GTP-binding protein